MSSNNKKIINRKKLSEVMRDLLQQGVANTQDALGKALAARGYKVNQSRISRLLHKLDAVKTKNAAGKMVYSLSKEPAPPAVTSAISDLIIDIISNETLIVIHSNPGSASLIARVLDQNREALGILGTVAGDDTIFIVPSVAKKITLIVQALQDLLLK